MTIQQTIAKAHYVATIAMVEQLAAAQWASARDTEATNGTYLKVVLVGAQAKTGTAKRGRHSKDSQLSILKDANAPFYAAVLRGLISADPTIAPDETLEPMEKSRRALERNRRSTFARTSYRELVGFVERGGDLRSLEPETVTKASLRAFGRPSEPTGRAEGVIDRAQGAILRAINREAKADPAGARDRLESVLGALRARLEELGSAQARKPVRRRATRESTSIRTRVGVPTFNQPGAA